MRVELCSEKLAPFIQNRPDGDRNTEKCNLGRRLDRKESDLNDSVKIVVGIAWVALGDKYNRKGTKKGEESEKMQ